MIYVVDAIMGAGKSSAAIWHIITSTDRFLYCTPYLSEVQRILEECKERRFREPHSGEMGEGGKKYSLMSLMDRGYNVATTHALFGQIDGDLYRVNAKDDSDIDSDIIALAREGGYSLIVDEAYDVIQVPGLNEVDVHQMIGLGLIEVVDGVLRLTEDARIYKGAAFCTALEIIRKHTIIAFDDNRYFSLVYPPEMFEAFEDVYVLFCFSALRVCSADALSVKSEAFGLLSP